MITDHLDDFESDLRAMLHPPCVLCAMDIDPKDETFTWANGAKAHLSCKVDVT